MAWIESHQTLEKHSKMLKMSIELEWETDKTIGFLHRFWWFVLINAEDGDLSKHTRQSLGMSLGVPEKVIDSLYNNNWIDTNTNLVHDWFDYAGYYLKMKYHTSDPKKYQKIQRLYTKKLGVPKGMPKGRLKVTPPIPYPLPIPKPIQTDKDISHTQVESDKPKRPLTDIQKVVSAFKYAKSIPLEDKLWNQGNYARAARSAKILLQMFEGNIEMATDCIFDKGEEFDKKELTWTLETILKHAYDYKQKREKENVSL